jgi:hypothetical protein
MKGNKFSATQDRMGNWTVRRLTDGAEVYLQGDDAAEFAYGYGLLESKSFAYPIGPFKTLEDHVDACLSDYEPVMELGDHT